jgi:hypothetical protein
MVSKYPHKTKTVLCFSGFGGVSDNYRNRLTLYRWCKLLILFTCKLINLNYILSFSVSSMRTTIGCPFSTLTSSRTHLHPATAYAVITDDNDIDKTYHKVVYSISKQISTPLRTPYINNPACNLLDFVTGTGYTGQFQIRQFHIGGGFLNIEKAVNIHARSFQTNGPDQGNSESNVEKSVKVLKDLTKNEVRLVPAEVYFRKRGIVAEPRKSLMTKIVDELKHYYHGFRLLFIDMKISLRLIWTLMKGDSLSRRERRQVSTMYRYNVFSFGLMNVRPLK